MFVPLDENIVNSHQKMCLKHYHDLSMFAIEDDSDFLWDMLTLLSIVYSNLSSILRIMAQPMTLTRLTAGSPAREHMI